jgi:hypothetical protein
MSAWARDKGSAAPAGFPIYVESRSVLAAPAVKAVKLRCAPSTGFVHNVV